MSMNYYVYRKPSESEKIQMIAEIVDNNWEDVNVMIPKKIHIGKSSRQFRFCFDHNGWKYFEKSRESLQSFMEKCIIVDESGQRIPFLSFWMMVWQKQDGISNTTYHGQPIGVCIDDLDFSNAIDFS